MIFFSGGSSARASLADLVAVVGLAFEVVGGSSAVAGEDTGMGSSVGRTVVAAEPAAI